MPLDARKATHVQNVFTRSLAGRQKTVVFVTQNGSGYSYSAVNVIFRLHEVINFELPDKAAQSPRQSWDALIVASITTSFVGVVCIADTPIANASAVQNARKYQVIEAIPVGILPGGTRMHAYLRHFV
jgi:hypothetical protein